jgi:hypothetical protein
MGTYLFMKNGGFWKTFHNQDEVNNILTEYKMTHSINEKD